MHSNAWNNGYDAAMRGQTSWSNPFRPGTDQWSDWIAGFNAYRRATVVRNPR